MSDQKQPKPKKSLLRKGLLIIVIGFVANMLFILLGIGGLLRELSRLAVIIGFILAVVGFIQKIIRRGQAK